MRTEQGFATAADSPAGVRGEIDLALVFEVVEDRVEVFIYATATGLLRVPTMRVAVGRGSEGPIVGYCKICEVDRSSALACSSRGVHGRGIVNNAYAAVG